MVVSQHIAVFLCMASGQTAVAAITDDTAYVTAFEYGTFLLISITVSPGPAGRADRLIDKCRITIACDPAEIPSLQGIVRVLGTGRAKHQAVIDTVTYTGVLFSQGAPIGIRTGSIPHRSGNAAGKHISRHAGMIPAGRNLYLTGLQGYRICSSANLHVAEDTAYATQVIAGGRFPVPGAVKIRQDACNRPLHCQSAQFRLRRRPRTVLEKAV